MKCCVYTRSFNEDPYIEFFIEHYISLGFDKIIILKADKINFDFDLDKYNNKIDVYYVDNLENRLLPKYTNKVPNYDWVLSVDIDEILLIKDDNIKDYINKRLTINKDINMFYFRWGMIEKYDNDSINTLKDLTKKYNIYENHHIKTMAKIKNIKSIWHPHLIDLKVKNIIFFENKIFNQNKPNKHNITQDSYQDSILIHIHTRSLNNLIIKSFTTKLGFIGRNKIIKKITNINDFVILINESLDDDLLQNFKKIVGVKAILPFNHSKTNKINFLFKTKNYKSDLVNFKKEKECIEYILIENNINIKEYYIKCEYIFNQVKKHFRSD